MKKQKDPKLEVRKVNPRGVLVVAEQSGQCLFCKDKVKKGLRCYEFAIVDPKAVRIWTRYAHFSCGQKSAVVVRGEDEKNYIPDEKILSFRRGMRALEIRRHS